MLSSENLKKSSMIIKSTTTKANATHAAAVIATNALMSKQRREPLFFFIMRLNLKAVLLFLTVAVVVITCAVYMRCSDFTFPQEFMLRRWDRQLYEAGNGVVESIGDNELGALGAHGAQLHSIDCLINQEYTIYCKRDIQTNEVYVPFSFLRSYFDIVGTVTGGSVEGHGTAKKFIWMHSNAKVNIPKGKYDTRGVFMYFENYNVEVRDRVKCISAAHGVPVSTQWEKRGYFYPTQIAQFGLAHYSKNLTEPAPKVKVLEDADKHQMNWTVPKGSSTTRIWHPKFNTTVVQYETAIGYDSAISIALNASSELVFSIDFLLATNSSSVMVSLQHQETKQVFRLHYIPADLVLSVQEENTYYGLGSNALNKWRHLTRDLHTDVQKGIAISANGIGDKKSQQQAVKIKRTELRVVSIAMLGVGFFDNVTLSTSAHLAHFYDAAEWLVSNQDKKTGGWPNPVKRSLNGFAELKSGWLSAMGQGHAISVLARAYWHSGGDKRYLKAASLGLKPYRVPSREGGVLAQFMDKYYWYEEYPTTPASYVLNGFIYSLLGLYDLSTTAPASFAREASSLFQQGMNSLKHMLLLYDTGSGTSYDLRHLTLGIAPNLARWDYHATHVNQLLLLATIDSDPIISQTAERWKGYMFGKRAKHN